MTTRQSHFLLSATPLFLLIFVDGLGLGLLLPILNTIILDPSASFLPLSTSTNWRTFWYGMTISIFMFCWFFGAAFFGDLSDKIGRKKALLLCLGGIFIGYILSAWAITIGSLLLLITGRVIAGFTSGSQAIAQAAIIDISSADAKVRNIGLIMLWSSLGFITGPLVGGFLSDHQLFSGFTFATPLYFAALVSLLSMILLAIFFQETFTVTGKISFRLYLAIEIFISAFRHEKVCGLSIVLLVLMWGWSNFFNFIPMFLLHRYHFSSIEIALYIALMSIGFSLGFSIFANLLSKHLTPANAVAVSLTIAATASLFTLIIQLPFVAWLMAIFIGAAMSVSYSVLINIFSNQVDSNSQGWVMGITGAVMALSAAVTTLTTTFLAVFSSAIPILCASIGLATSAWLMRRQHQIAIATQTNTSTPSLDTTAT